MRRVWGRFGVGCVYRLACAWAVYATNWLRVPFRSGLFVVHHPRLNADEESESGKDGRGEDYEPHDMA